MLRIRAAALATIAAHARADPARECCGFLIGTPEQIVEAAAATNVADDPARRYEISSTEYLSQIRRTRGTPYGVVGAYHSHPRSAPEPSPTDLELAFGEFVYIIAGPVAGAGPLDARAYRLVEGRLARIPLIVAGD